MKQIWRDFRGPIVTVVCFALVLCFMLSGASSLSHKNDARQLQLVRQAVIRASVTCYATEGFYPPDVEYLRRHYGLTWDDSRYIVHYDCFSSNIMPDVDVLIRGAEK